MTIATVSEHPDDGPGRRRYESALRRNQARATRASIAEAARRLFSANGWAGTRVRDVAREAGVAEPTVYAIYENKAGLARALVEAVELSADLLGPDEVFEQHPYDPAGQLAALVSSDRRLFERGGDVIALMRDAARSEPDLHTVYQQARAHADRLRREIFATWPAEALREGTTPACAADTFAALSNIDVYRVLTEERGWTPDQVEQWWQESLSLLILR